MDERSIRVGPQDFAEDQSTGAIDEAVLRVDDETAHPEGIDFLEDTPPDHPVTELKVHLERAEYTSEYLAVLKSVSIAPVEGKSDVDETVTVITLDLVDSPEYLNTPEFIRMKEVLKEQIREQMQKIFADSQNMGNHQGEIIVSEDESDSALEPTFNLKDEENLEKLLEIETRGLAQLYQGVSLHNYHKITDRRQIAPLSCTLATATYAYNALWATSARAGASSG